MHCSYVTCTSSSFYVTDFHNSLNIHIYAEIDMNSLKREYGDLDKLLVSASDVKIYDLLGEGILNHML